MRTHDYFLLAFAALVLAVGFATSKAPATTDDASVHGYPIAVSGLGRGSIWAPDEDFPPH